MKNILLLSFLLSFNLHNLVSQNSGVIIYKSINQFGIISFYKLYFDEKKSIYVANVGKKSIWSRLTQQLSIDDTISDSEEKILEAKRMDMKQPIYTKYIDEEGDLVYKNFKESVMIFRQILPLKPLIVNEQTIPNLNWILVNENKTINNFKCQKATTSFRGRNYVAWFTREIPVSNGPWKLQGLPGLILEASTDDHKFNYEPLSIEIPAKSISAIKPPEIGEKINVKEYINIMKSKLEELIRQLKLASTQRGASMEFSFGANSKMQPQELNYDDLK